jgi:LacI family transcriptional regulator
MAMNLYKLLNQLGISIPEDISVIGFDNYTMISELLEPGLTTVELPYTEIGKRGAKKLMNLIQGDEGESDILLERVTGEVIWRNSLLGI